MAKYIDADTVVGLMQFDDYGWTVETDTIENILDNFTEDGCPEFADVAPVEYGEWMSTPEICGAFDIRYYCSKCGKDAIINNSERYVLSDYCPHCGAIMNNKRGNENG